MPFCAVPISLSQVQAMQIKDEATGKLKHAHQLIEKKSMTATKGT